MHHCCNNRCNNICNCNSCNKTCTQNKYTTLKSLSIESLADTTDKKKYEDTLFASKITRNAFFSAKAAVYNFICDVEELSSRIKSDISDNKFNLQSIKDQYISILNILMATLFASLNQCYNNKKLINVNMAKVNKTTKLSPLRSTNLIFVHPVSCKTNVLSYIPSVSIELNVITEELRIKFCEPEYIDNTIRHANVGKDRDLCKTFVLGPPIQCTTDCDISDNNFELLKAFGCSTLDLDIVDSIEDVFDNAGSARKFLDEIINYQDYCKSSNVKINNNILSIMNYFDKVINSMENSHRYVVQTSKINEDLSTPCS